MIKGLIACALMLSGIIVISIPETVSVRGILIWAVCTILGLCVYYITKGGK